MMDEIPPLRAEDISIIIPVLHEADTIRKVVVSVRSMEGGAAPEIVVVDPVLVMDTLMAIADRTDVVKIGSAKGRALQMNEGARTAKGKVLLFLHSDTTLPNDGL